MARPTASTPGRTAAPSGDDHTTSITITADTTHVGLVAIHGESVTTATLDPAGIAQSFGSPVLVVTGFSAGVAHRHYLLDITGLGLSAGSYDINVHTNDARASDLIPWRVDGAATDGSGPAGCYDSASEYNTGSTTPSGVSPSGPGTNGLMVTTAIFREIRGDTLGGDLDANILRVTGGISAVERLDTGDIDTTTPSSTYSLTGNTGFTHIAYTFAEASGGGGPTTYDESVSDGAVFGDSPSSQVQVAGSVSDGAVFGDAPSAQLQTAPSLSDGFTVGDAPGAQEEVAGSVADALLLGDAPSASEVVGGTVADGILFGDSTSSQTEQVGDLSDGLILGDTPSAQAVVNAGVSDGFILGDATAVGSITGDVSDGLLFGDTTDAQLEVQAALSDRVLFGDSPSAQTVFGRAISDGVLFGDSPSSAGVFGASLSDGVLFGDTPGVISLGDFLDIALSTSHPLSIGLAITYPLGVGLALAHPLDVAVALEPKES